LLQRVRIDELEPAIFAPRQRYPSALSMEDGVLIELSPELERLG
jgi:hypothetical protein